MIKQQCQRKALAEQRGKRLGSRCSRAWGLPAAIMIAFLGNAPAVVGAENAAPEAHFDAEFLLAIGGFFPYIESDVSLSTSGGGSNQDISGEGDLGLEQFSATPWIDFNWRFLPRHQLQVEWFQLNRGGSSSAQRDLSFGDTTATIGAALSSKVDMNIGRVTYGYSFIRSEQHDLSVLVGAHIATFKATITATGAISVGGGPVMMGSSTESSSTYTFPLPHIGTQYSYKFAPRWTLDLRLLGFALEIDEYKGYLVEVDGLVSYQLTKNFGIGGGLKYFKLNLQAKDTSLSGEYDFQFYGPAIFGYVSF